MDIADIAAKAVKKILLTASGGPFRGKTQEELMEIRVEDALKHPNWSMGQKITIDSSTLANKGLEVIEAKWLFEVDVDDVQVVVQPQSIIHSMVEYVDGAIIAELGTPDMKLPIQYALYYPERRFLPGDRVDFWNLGKLEFEKPDMRRTTASEDGMEKRKTVRRTADGEDGIEKRSARKSAGANDDGERKVMRKKKIRKKVVKKRKKPE